ncbi:MAG TPA: hypothetical protein VHH53_10530, partial [Pseudonocardiaceae bacterium]|nr:hypothetical protein [Pseudonocardiaceae bacterium]
AASAVHIADRRTMALLLATILLTHVEFPFWFFDLPSGEPVSRAVLTARNVCLITLAFCAVRAWLAASGTQSAGGSHERELPAAMPRSLASERPDHR